MCKREEAVKQSELLRKDHLNGVLEASPNKSIQLMSVELVASKIAHNLTYASFLLDSVSLSLTQFARNSKRQLGRKNSKFG